MEEPEEKKKVDEAVKEEEMENVVPPEAQAPSPHGSTAARAEASSSSSCICCVCCEAQHARHPSPPPIRLRPCRVYGLSSRRGSGCVGGAGEHKHKKSDSAAFTNTSSIAMLRDKDRRRCSAAKLSTLSVHTKRGFWWYIYADIVACRTFTSTVVAGIASSSSSIRIAFAAFPTSFAAPAA
ncbi:hypothetical protein CVT26_005485 [Gymnopilus dilepis]|uniref:Uncharacterized protein n=1 Tax=Gymnopilus dilepis TaxID=231916 RepID=A0A409WJQ9_9AGAR|nr:hypothetical protein CVT26_005485 [Gymnopilus dilepis]